MSGKRGPELAVRGQGEAALDTLREPVSPRGKVMLIIGST